jgi:predicted peroxiredoxin
MGQNPVLYYLGMGLTMLKPGALEQVQLGSFPSAREMMDAVLSDGIPLYACEASKQMLGWDTVELIDGAKVVGAATLNDLALDASATICF